ncbi:MAG: translocation/assembly module TamB domain-containing protein, partial [Pseudomonadota bacterium]
SLAGALALPPEGPPTGTLALDVPSLSTVAPLLLTRAGEASGSLGADITLSAEGDEATADVEARGRGIVFGDIRAGDLSADLRVADYLGTPRPEGVAEARNVQAAGLTFSAIDLAARQTAAGRFALTLDADGREVSLDAAADLTLADGTTTLDLGRAAGSAYGLPIRLAGPARIIVGETTRVEGLALDLGSGRVSVSGTAAPTLDLAVEARALPLSLADLVAPDLGLTGTLSGSATVRGEPSDPDVVFDLAGQGLSAAPLAAAGLSPLTASASGRLQDRRLAFEADASGPFEVSAGGGVDLTGAEPVLDIDVSGRASTDPLIDRLARAGVRADADIAFDVSIDGPASDPSITGSLNADGATVGDAEGRFILRDVSADISLDGDRVVIERVTGAIGPGSLLVTGTVGLTGDLPADLSITVDGGRVADGTLVVATVDADLDLFGPLLGGPTLAGRIDLVRTLVTLNDLPSGGLDPIEVRHVNAPADVIAQAQRLGIDAAESGGSGAGSATGGAALLLDITVATREPISVRGRGLTVDLAGDLRLLGPIDDIRAIGAFTLVRGQLDLLGERLVFDRARLDFTGDLNPRIDFAATTEVDGFAITLRLFGRTSAPEITVTSVPDLPQDEALARLLFGRALSDLSPFQIARLAQGISTLTGGTGPLDGALAALGLSGLDIDVDEDGNATLGLGQQLNERTYVNVEQSSAGSSRVVIDLEITGEVKARGSFDSDGAAGLGVFFEREY